MTESWKNSVIAFLFLALLQGCGPKGGIEIEDTGEAVQVNTEHYRLNIGKKGFRYSFLSPDGEEIAPSHPRAGLQIAEAGQTPAPVSETRLVQQENDHLVFEVETETGLTATVTVRILPHAVKMEVRPQEEGLYAITAGIKGLGPAYGMGDHAAMGSGSGKRTTVELTGFSADTLRGHRMISNFAIFPKQGFAEVNMEPGLKMVRFTEEENLQGSLEARSMPALYYFIGSPEEIYAAYLKARNEEGYTVYKPKYEWFGVGWEAFGALAWMTNQKTVTDDINKYLELGFPLEWMVVGSGFWPRGEGEFDEHGTPYGSETTSEAAKKLQATTSFGMWDKQLYPDPKGMIDYFHDKGLLFTIGLRIGFIPGGPFTGEGVEKGYFIKDEQGGAKLFKVGFPRVPVHLLDARNAEAVDWYARLCKKWMDYGVDGFKEDLFGYPQDLPDDLIDPVNEALMDQGVYIMGRNMYLGSPADIHRYNDFNYNQFQDRGPINGLAYAYSGFPYVYPDIVGGTGLTTGRFGNAPEETQRKYLMRYAQYAALNPSMAFGYGPWNLGEEAVEVTLEAARLHDRLQPYIYSNAIKTFETGFPYTMTPLPLAYPGDPGVYGLADSVRRSYEWLIGESLLATPLYGDDYASADSRDVYLPEGTWIEYDNGQRHTGPVTLEDYPLPVGKTPLFVGGQGIVVEETDGNMMARVYPVADTANFVFYGQDAEVFSRISVESPNWDALKVVDKASGEEIEVALTRHAYEFRLESGHDYIVK